MLSSAVGSGCEMESFVYHSMRAYLCFKQVSTVAIGDKVMVNFKEWHCAHCALEPKLTLSKPRGSESRS